MAVHQRINNGRFDNVELFLPHDSQGRLKMLIGSGAKVKFHRPENSRLSMLINGKQRVNL
jgi:hypothetical protein